jgi:hypothetical protein
MGFSLHRRTRNETKIHLTHKVPDFQTGMSSVPDPPDSTCSFRPCSDRQSSAWKARSVPAPRQSPDKDGDTHSHQCERGSNVEKLYCKRPIQCLASSKILTLHPLIARRVCTHPPLVRGEDTLAGWRGGGGSIVRKTPLYSTYVSTLWVATKPEIGANTVVKVHFITF